MDRCPHNDEYACFSCEMEAHDRDHPVPVDDCVTCKYQSIRLSAAATPNKTKSPTPPRQANPAWERGIAKDHRGVPYLKGDGTPIGVKQFAENRSKYEEAIRKNRQATLQPATA